MDGYKSSSPSKDFGNEIYTEMDWVIGLSTQKYII